MDNVATVKTAYEAFGRGDIPAVLAVLADDVEWCSPLTLAHGGQFSGKAGVGEFFQGIGAQWISLELEIHGVAALSADTVVGVVTASGELRSAGSAGYGAAHVFTFANGKVVRFQEYVDLDKPLT
jgi:ketosteroid isomerase-like protein